MMAASLPAREARGAPMTPFRPSRTLPALPETRSACRGAGVRLLAAALANPFPLPRGSAPGKRRAAACGAALAEAEGPVTMEGSGAPAWWAGGPRPAPHPTTGAAARSRVRSSSTAVRASRALPPGTESEVPTTRSASRPAAGAVLVRTAGQRTRLAGPAQRIRYTAASAAPAGEAGWPELGPRAAWSASAPDACPAQARSRSGGMRAVGSGPVRRAWRAAAFAVAAVSRARRWWPADRAAALGGALRR